MRVDSPRVQLWAFLIASIPPALVLMILLVLLDRVEQQNRDRIEAVEKIVSKIDSLRSDMKERQ